MLSEFENIHLEENDEYLKITWPISQNRGLFYLFTLSLIVWLLMLAGVVAVLVQDVARAGERYTFLLTIMLLIWLLIWLGFGRILWKRWQYHTADREIVFIDDERLIIRRPVSILGITDAYDMQHINLISYNDNHHCLVFEYGQKNVYFGHSLNQDEATILAEMLNGRFFPNFDDEQEMENLD